MKKIMIVLGVCVLLLAMPAMTAISIPKIKNVKTIVGSLSNRSSEDAPMWADGSFNGTWGLREWSFIAELFGAEDGMVEIEIGNISGYYGNIIGFINGIVGQIYPHYNHSKTVDIGGICLGRILFGEIGEINVTDIESEYSVFVEEANYVGIGALNDTSFDYRIMSYKGPTFYIKGTFTKFD
jgi:hypothetical protein